jgi:hypothetical protein
LEQIVTDVAQTFGYCRSAILLTDETTNDLVITHGWTGDRIANAENRPGTLNVPGYRLFTTQLDVTLRNMSSTASFIF